jgi:cell wall-associated NlpC family hydrolase
VRKDKAIKLAVCIISSILFLSVPYSIAHADRTIFAEEGVAGIAALLDNMSIQDLENAYKASIELMSAKSPYANLGVSKADSYVNIRKEPSTESEIVGKLYRGCAADILETLPGDWVKIKSGNVEGYIASNYLAIGDAAEDMVDEYATKYATVNTQTLRVREAQSTDSKILTLIPQGQTYVVINEYDEWVEILLGADEDTGGNYTGFVNKEYVDITVEFKFAISIEEENAIRQKQEEAERAEEERKRKLAEEKAEREEAERRAQEAAQNAETPSNNNDSAPSSGSSSSLDGLRKEVITYALKFVGNPYVWGGESLTRGADCSGFVQSVYGDFGYSIPRVSRDQATYGKKVSESDLKPGDLIFYANSSGRVNHVAMYIGNGKIVQAANSRQGIITSSYKYRDIYCIRRIIY